MNERPDQQEIFFEEVLERLSKEVADPFWSERIGMIEQTKFEDDVGASLCVVLHVLLLKLEHLRAMHRAYEEHFSDTGQENGQPRVPFDGRLPNEVTRPLLAGRYYAKRPTH